ncbi:MAG: hypothetical protein ACRDHZ_08240 [Ktedonobacteraceae bacterium]
MNESRQLSPHEHVIADALGTPTWNCIERRHASPFCLETLAGVVQLAP